jgi:hypothetical protein
VASDAFADAWISANRAAHAGLVAALTGQTGEGITIENDTVSINLGPFIQVVKQRLIDRGFELANRIPDVNPSFVLVQSDAIARARDAFNFLSPDSGRAERGYRLATRGAEKAGFRTGPVGAWVYTYKRVLWIVVIAIAALVLVFWDQPTGRVIIGITLACWLRW